jgi:hypothetical protein
MPPLRLLETKRTQRMTLLQRRRLEEMLMAAMTSGLAHKGAKYVLPESLAIEYGRICYNLAIQDVMSAFKCYDMGTTGMEIFERVSDLNLTQKIDA